MSKSIGLLSSALISCGEFKQFVASNGGVVTDDQTGSGRVSKGTCHIWVDMSPEELTSFLEDNDEDVKAQLVAMLGGVPQTWVSVDISRKEGSDFLALEFASQFGSRWPTVVYTDDDALLTPDEMRERHAVQADP